MIYKGRATGKSTIPAIWRRGGKKINLFHCVIGDVNFFLHVRNRPFFVQKFNRYSKKQKNLSIQDL